jgi:hypothetical protein
MTQSGKNKFGKRGQFNSIQNKEKSYVLDRKKCRRFNSKPVRTYLIIQLKNDMWENAMRRRFGFHQSLLPCKAFQVCAAS